MTAANKLRWGLAAVAAALLAAWGLGLFPPRGQNAAVEIDPDDIGGVVTSSAGREAGVWVIAETADFQTRYSKIVVTDDRGDEFRHGEAVASYGEVLKAVRAS